VTPLADIDVWLERVLGIPQSLTDHVVGTAAVVVTYLFVQRLTRRILFKTVEDIAARFSLLKTLTYVYGGVAFLMIVRVWFQSLTGLATYLGLLSAGLAIALQDLLANFAGWIFILVRTPFRIGDRIEIGAHVGDVVDIRPFRFMLLEVGKWVHAEQSTGRVVHIPNGWVFKQSVANYEEAFGLIWNEIEVVVTYESDWRAAKSALDKVLTDKVEELTDDDVKLIAKRGEEYHIRVGKLTPVVWVAGADHGVRLTMRYMCRARDRRRSTSEMWSAILDAIDGLDRVDLAYPTTRRFDHSSEGKAALRPPGPVASARSRD
jgi:small-conductance mechanosensitive channel